MGIVVTQAVDDLLNATPTGAAALRVVDANKIAVQIASEGPPAFFVDNARTKTKYIVVNTSLPPQEVAFYFCHEAHHARQNLSGASGDAKAQDRAAFIETMVNEEAVGSAIGYEFLEELRRAGRAITKPEPFRYDMYSSFVARKRKELTADHADWSAEKIDAAVTAFGRRYVRAMVNDGFLRPNALDLYSDYYAREWARAHPPK